MILIRQAQAHLTEQVRQTVGLDTETGTMRAGGHHPPRSGSVTLSRARSGRAGLPRPPC